MPVHFALTNEPEARAHSVLIERTGVVHHSFEFTANAVMMGPANSINASSLASRRWKLAIDRGSSSFVR